jgi:hypothetical protein
MEIRKIIITVEVGHLRVVDTPIRTWAIHSAVEGARITHLVAEGDMMAVEAGARLCLVLEMGQWLQVSRTAVKKTRIGAL